MYRIVLLVAIMCVQLYTYKAFSQADSIKWQGKIITLSDNEGNQSNPGFSNKDNAVLLELIIELDVERQSFSVQDLNWLTNVGVYTKKNLSIFLAPRFKLSNGESVENLQFKTFDQWLKLEKNYHSTIMQLAFDADSIGVAIFSIGNQLKSFYQFRPKYFRNLSDTLHDSTAMLLTYVSTESNYPNYDFWRKMDFVTIKEEGKWFAGGKESEQNKKALVTKKYQWQDFSDRLDKSIVVLPNFTVGLSENDRASLSNEFIKFQSVKGVFAKPLSK